MSTATAAGAPIGPVDLAVIGFRGELRQDGIRDAVARAVDRGAVRVLDVLLVRKDDDGSVLTVRRRVARGCRGAARLPDRSCPTSSARRTRSPSPPRWIPAPRCSSSPGRTRGPPRSPPRCAALDGQLLVMERLPREDVEVALSARSQSNGGGVMRGRRGRPGLMGLAARTAVVAGTASAVSGKVQQGQQAKAQQAADAEAFRQQQQEQAEAPGRAGCTGRACSTRLIGDRRRARSARATGRPARAGRPHRRGVRAAEGAHPGLRPSTRSRDRRPGLHAPCFRLG